MRIYRRLRLVVGIWLLLTCLLTACNEATPTPVSPVTTPATTITAPTTAILTTQVATTAASVNTSTSPATTLPATATLSATTQSITTNVATTTAAIATTSAPTANATPYTISLASTAPFGYGVASGDMTSDSVVLWTRTPTSVSVTPQLSESETFSSSISLPMIQTDASSDFTLKVVAKNLKPGTKYYYRFVAGSDVSQIGSFKTAYAPDQNAKVTMAFSGDADWKWKPYPLLNSLVKENLDYFFFLGDLLYETSDLAGKTSVEDLNGYRFKYRENREARLGSDGKMIPMLDLYRLFGQYSVFDNHETGLSKADKNAPSYNEGGVTVGGKFVNQSDGFKARIQAYREYQPVTDELVAGTGDTRVDQTYKFYNTVQWGANAELLILDDRSYRDSRLASSDDAAASSCSRTMLGAPQLKWFEEQLIAAQQHKTVWKVVVVSSPIQELGRASQIGSDMDGGKSWAGGYNCERNQLLKFIDDNAIENVVFLTTDNHYTVVNNLKYNTVADDPKSPLKAARNAIEILTGPMGASAGTPALKVDIKGLAIRDADRKILQTWNGDVPNSDGQLKGLKQAGLDPIGLEADFPGLDKSSIKATGGTPGTVEPLDFASFNTYSYAVLTFDQSSLGVQVKGLPLVSDPAVLLTPAAEKEYESRTAQEIFSFQIKAQP